MWKMFFLSGGLDYDLVDWENLFNYTWEIYRLLNNVCNEKIKLFLRSRLSLLMFILYYDICDCPNIVVHDFGA